MQELKVLELFAGLGACSKALEKLNIPHKIVDAVEIDKYAIQSFNAIHGTNFEPQDITSWDKDINVDLICHGSPCTNFSMAGKQEGGDKGSGTPSSLMYESIRIIEKLKPKYVIWENVKNLLSKKHIYNFNAYLETMEKLGYNNYYQVLNAKDYGIPQNRERVFTISIRNDLNQTFVFPPKQELKLKLKDMLEDEVDDSFYWNKLSIDELKKLDIDDITFKWNSKVKRFVFNEKIDLNMTYSLNAYNNSVSYIHHTITTPHNVLFILHKCKIRKLTPKECWRLMGFDDEDFEKASFKKETSYIEGDLKCNAKLKIVNEKQRHLDMETYVLCTTNDMLDMETPIRTKWKKSIENENNEKMQNVNIAIEMLDEVEQKECVTNIIKCGENITILYTLMEELDQCRMAIIGLGKRGKANIEKYMKITLEENLNPMKLYTISTLIEQIIKSKIYTCITQKANIQGNIAIIEDCVKNLKMMKLSNLKMDYITRLNSDTMLYKQAGNSIVVTVLEAIFTELLSEYIQNLDKWSDLD